MSLEQYQCPFGRKTELVKKRDELQKEADILLTNYLSQVSKIAKLESENRHLWISKTELETQLYHRQHRMPLPMLEHIVEMSE